MVVQTGHLGDVSDRGSVQEEYLGNQKVFCHESNFPGRPTHQGFTMAWNYKKRFMGEEVMHFTIWRFPRPSICENQIFERDSSQMKKRPEPKPIIGFKMGLSAFQKDRNQEKCPRNYKVMVHSPKPARSKTKQLLSLSHETGGNSKTSTFICANESVKCHGRNQFTKDVPTEFNCFLPSYHSDGLRENQTEKAPKSSEPEKLMEQSARTEPNVTSQPILCQSQEHCKDHELIVSAHHENVLTKIFSLREHFSTWLKNVLLEHKLFHDLFSLSCALKEIWSRKKHEPKLLRPENQIDFTHVEKFLKLAFSYSYPIGLKTLLDLKTSKPISSNQFTCLLFTHVLDDYLKSLDHVYDVLRIEKPFDYFFRRFDVVSLVVLKVQDKHDQSPIEASTGDQQRIYKPGTWSWMYLREISSKLQGSFCPKFSFIEFYMILKFILSDLFSFDSGKMDLRSNPFEEGGNDAPWIEHRPAWVMDTAHRGDLVNHLDQTKVSPSDRTERTVQTVPSDHPDRFVYADTPQNQVQYMEPDQDGVQTDQDSTAEVRPSDQARLIDRAVYRLDPCSSGKELRLDSRPADQISRPIDHPTRPSRPSKDDSRTRPSLGRVVPEDERAFSLLTHLGHADERDLDLQSVFDPLLDFAQPNLSKTRILHLSEDLGQAWTRLVREDHTSGRKDQPACVLLLTAVYPSGSDEPGQ